MAKKKIKANEKLPLKQSIPAVKVDKLKVGDIIEVQRIFQILNSEARDQPELLSMFKVLCMIANKRINQEDLAVFFEDIEDLELVLDEEEDSDEEDE